MLYQVFKDYVGDMDITSAMFPAYVSIQGLETRTSNDVEDWHTRNKANKQKDLYIIAYDVNSILVSKK